MAEPYSPATLHRVMERTIGLANKRAHMALFSLALKIENEARDSLKRTSHAAGEPTKASPGGPPSLVTGQLRQSIGHEVTHKSPLGLSIRVGTRTTSHMPSAGKHGRRGSGSRVTSDVIGLALETGKSGRWRVKYPFMEPAFNAQKANTLSLFKSAFHGGWKHG